MENSKQRVDPEQVVKLCERLQRYERRTHAELRTLRMQHPSRKNADPLVGSLAIDALPILVLDSAPNRQDKRRPSKPPRDRSTTSGTRPSPRTPASRASRRPSRTSPREPSGIASRPQRIRPSRTRQRRATAATAPAPSAMRRRTSTLRPPVSSVRSVPSAEWGKSSATATRSSSAFVGQPIFAAQRHQFEQGRCRICGAIFTAEGSPQLLREGVGTGYILYEWSACAMLSVMHYFAGGSLQTPRGSAARLGAPMPDAN
jgi:hypothetical protein